MTEKFYIVPASRYKQLEAQLNDIESVQLPSQKVTEKSPELDQLTTPIVPLPGIPVDTSKKRKIKDKKKNSDEWQKIWKKI